ncbi:MAG: UDP-N-acetylmuramoyl-L-alanyl-D-glutamate--2,6-diaminopimelate ligase [Desulfobacterales bacterium]|nr:UDP-N-acetylmuramoyl-L-alanyl-D-glutamate--2,6-diaminopimelate ligase [Desulfobacterales bacterium]
MKLGRILKGMTDYDLIGNPDREIEGLAYDSRQIKPGYLFVAIRGNRLDGHHFLEKAVECGAAALVAEDFNDLQGAAEKVRVPDARRALSKLAVQFYDRPFTGLRLIGITGTNGKTTTSYLLESILAASGAKPGVLGTINYRFSGKNTPAPVTTPESLDLMRLIREMADGGATDVIMEVSSHALDQRRTEDCPFRAAIFTNISRDHLDYHKNMDAYFRAKSRLFQGLERGGPGEEPHAIINIDDPKGKDLVGLTRARVLTYGLGKKADVRADSIHRETGGMRARLITPVGEQPIRSSLIGEFNVYNIMAAAGAAISLGIPLDKVAQGIAQLKTVPGRLEPVENRKGIIVVVDYAHTPDALLKALEALKPYAEGRLITVFGCGGDRDKGKREVMGLVAGEHSDLVFITSDNPRSEDPSEIVKEIEKGTRKSGLEKREWAGRPRVLDSGYFVEVDRREAIRRALSTAEKRDVVLIAGKGHEDYQIVGSERRHFDDREEAAQAVSGGE